MATKRDYIIRNDVYRQMMKRGVPIWVYALEAKFGHSVFDHPIRYDIVRVVMDKKGNMEPRLLRPHTLWPGDEVRYFPNWFQAWAYRLRLENEGQHDQDAHR